MYSFTKLENTETLPELAVTTVGLIAGALLGGNLNPTEQQAFSTWEQNSIYYSSTLLSREGYGVDSSIDGAFYKSDYSSHLEKIKQSISNFEKNEKDRISKAISNAYAFENIHKQLKMPHIILSQDGEVNLWWENNGSRLDLSFFEKDEYYYYCRLRDGTEILADDVPIDRPLPSIIRKNFI